MDYFLYAKCARTIELKRRETINHSLAYNFGEMIICSNLQNIKVHEDHKGNNN